MPTETNQWLTVSYQPVSLFTLKRSDATNMAAKSNLVPTPYTIKMALLKVMLENFGKHHANDFAKWIKKEFTWIRDLQIYIQPPERIIVNRNGYKLRYYDQTTDKADKTRPTLAMQDGFVFREWVFLEGELQLCLGPTQRLEELENLLSQINYFGKRSCFFQYLSDRTFSSIEPQLQSTFDQGFILQPLDDMGKTTTFDKINPFSSERAILNKDRIPTIGFLPLRLIETSTRYDFYERY
ncbi:hypothetical protein C7H19_10735 [Aphanothece hegewaldii CCALA 016]|uniref:CRISPR-associated protein Cas5 n=1 Tax=Aphanothece hegewaldii CCALA 016 TaxID=2107694 RepID=A0A2T1LYF8_9CHRO|nr:hypothetical protein [Aphanothece hegewaldii]PSF37394.1 hypothetical protein C7H19_10735 [Aphanothece hegewaldii CCALA 016]